MGSKNKNSRMNKKEKPESDAGATEAAKDGGSRHGGKKVITDSRFASVHSDPRFAKLSKRKAKVAIDSRFDRMFTDKRFSSSSAHIDKRGKPKKDTSQNPLKHYYRLEEEEELAEKEQKSKVKSEDIKSDGESEENESERESEEELENLGKESSDLELKSDSEALESDGDEDEDVESDGESSTGTTDSDEEDEMLLEEEDTFVQEESIPEIDKETRRLAVVNLDWSHVKAIDLYVLLSSFLPKGGQILSVAIYPSEFGLKRMEEEAVHGPVGLFDNDKEKNESDDDDDDQFDKEKLRAYELRRLKYYYAVVECDSIATADYLYKTCDGVEFERSSNKLDLRFIPDSMEFKHPPRDTATEAPGDYEGIDFHTRALQLSDVQLTWDEDEPQRAKALKRKFNAEQLADLQLKEFLASDEDETDEDESGDDKEDQPAKKRNKKELYRDLLQSGEGSVEDDEDGQDMEVTFNTGLEDISKRILEKKDKKSETVWEAYLRKRREKKKARKNKSKDSTDDESSDSDEEPKENLDDFFIDETSVKGSKKGHGKSGPKGKNNEEMAKEAEASRAELELLLADDNGEETGLKGYNMKPKKAKGKKGKEIHNEEKIPSVDYDDPRFSALFTSHLYALDPTDPQFKRSAAYARQLAQKQRKGGEEELQPKDRAKSSRQAPQPSGDVETENKHLKSDELTTSKKENYEISSVVKSIKMKSKHLQMSSNTKISSKSEKLRVKAR